jgi:hypothetical protein
MRPDSTVVLTVQFGNERPDLRLAAERLGIPEADIDAAFGLLPVEIGGSEYAVRVKTTHLQLPRPGVEGPFADPPIDAM